MEHLLTFANLKQSGLLVEQQQAETLTVMESKVGKLVNDKTAGTVKAHFLLQDLIGCDLMGLILVCLFFVLFSKFLF